MTQEEFIKLLDQSTSNTDIEYTPAFFRLKKTYPDIVNKESLLKHLLTQQKYGVLDDDKLERSYKGIAQDVAQLIEEGWIRVIEFQDNNIKKANAEKKRVLFACDLSNTEVEQPFLAKKCQDYISKVWSTQVGDNVVTNWEKILQEQPGLLSD